MVALEGYSRLLADAARLYERHRRRGQPPFNLFPVLRHPTDEVICIAASCTHFLNTSTHVAGGRRTLQRSSAR